MLNDKFVITFIFKGGETLNHNEYFNNLCIIDYNTNKPLFDSALKCETTNKNRQKSGLNDKNSENL